jgi:hypothetical protein
MLRHHCPVTLNALAMKGRLHQSPLPAVKLSFAREQALAQEALRSFESAPFHE